MRKKQDDSTRVRVLRFENLENRDLLSINTVFATSEQLATRADAIFAAVNQVDASAFTVASDDAELSNAVADAQIQTLAQPKITDYTSVTKSIFVEWDEDMRALMRILRSI